MRVDRFETRCNKLKLKKREITAKQERAIVALLSEQTLDAAAAKVGCRRSTIWRWLQTREFSDAYRSARSELVRAALSLLESGAAEAVGVLQTVMRNPNSRDEVRVNASRILLELMLRAVETENLERRVAALEQSRSFDADREGDGDARKANRKARERGSRI